MLNRKSLIGKFIGGHCRRSNCVSDHARHSTSIRCSPQTITDIAITDPIGASGCQAECGLEANDPSIQRYGLGIGPGGLLPNEEVPSLN